MSSTTFAFPKLAISTSMKKVFLENTEMETQTVFYENGHIIITPCSFELGQNIVSGKTIVSQVGRMVTEDNGTSHFRPFEKGTGSRYRKLYSTPHGEVKETNDQVIFQLRFPKKLGKELIETLLHNESEQMQEWVQSRETETKW